MEIYNSWGSSECSEKEGNPRPIKGTGPKTLQEYPEGSIRKALTHNCRFGFVAGGLDDRCLYADLFDTNQEQYSPGLTAILAKDHSRTSLIEALQKKTCYATTGAKHNLGLYIGGEKMRTER